MLSKEELRSIAEARLGDAEALCNADRYDGAAYLCGYAIEIGLKLRICKTLRWEGFPEAKREFDNLQSFRTHNLDVLLHLSGFEEEVKQNHLGDWSIVKTWNPESRYNRVGTIPRQKVIDLISATKNILQVL